MESLGFNIFDAIIIGLIILLSIKGLLNGFTKELFNSIGLIGGLFIASYYKKDLAIYIHDNYFTTLSMPLLELISLLVIFILIFIVAKLLYKIIELATGVDYISSASRLSGMLIKMVTLFFVFSLIIFGLSSKPQVLENFKDTLSGSKLFPILKDSGSYILNAPELLDNALKKDESGANMELNDTNNKIKEEQQTKEEENKTLDRNETTINSSTLIQDKNRSEENSSAKDNNSSSIESNDTNHSK